MANEGTLVTNKESKRWWELFACEFGWSEDLPPKDTSHSMSDSADRQTDGLLSTMSHN
jgi:hypothetical protein